MIELHSENLTGLGGPMGSERTWTNFRRYYSSVAKAKAAAEKDYGKPIKWVRENGHVRSPDLGHVMYHIKLIKVEA